MELRWNKKDILSYMKNIINKEQNICSSKDILQLYTDYLNDSNEEFLKVDEQKKQEKNISVSDVMEAGNTLLNALNKLPKCISQEILTFIDCCGKLPAEVFQQEKLSFGKKSNEELYDQSFKIFSDVSPKFVSFLNYIYDKNLVYLSNDFKKGSFCRCDDFNGLGFVYVDKSNKNYSIESTLNHELAHSIAMLTNCNYSNKNNSTYNLLCEVPSLYIDFKTNKKFYEGTGNLNYLKSNFNYYTNIKNLVYRLKILLEVLQTQDPSKRNIVTRLYDNLGIKIGSFDNFFGDRLDNIEESIKYILSCLVVLHLLDMDEDKANDLYTDIMFNDYYTVSNFLKRIDYDTKDRMYSMDLFDRNYLNTKNLIRKR